MRAGKVAASGFTLIELMLVSVLLALLVGVTTVRLDGFSETGRLRSAARQIGALYRMARMQALTDGRPRLVSYLDTAEQGTRLQIQSPRLNRDVIEWPSSEGFRLTGEVRIERIVQDGQTEDRREGVSSVWIGADGVANSHVVVLMLAGRPRAAGVIDGVTGEDRFVLIDDPGKFDPQELLKGSDETTGAHAR